MNQQPVRITESAIWYPEHNRVVGKALTSDGWQDVRVDDLVAEIGFLARKAQP